MKRIGRRSNRCGRGLEARAYWSRNDYWLSPGGIVSLSRFLAWRQLRWSLECLSFPLSDADMGLQRACLEELHNAETMPSGYRQEGWVSWGEGIYSHGAAEQKAFSPIIFRVSWKSLLGPCWSLRSAPEFPTAAFNQVYDHTIVWEGLRRCKASSSPLCVQKFR